MAERQERLEHIKKDNIAYWPIYATPRAEALGNVYSCMGEIAAHSGVLKNYDVEKTGSGIFEQDGITYSYDEYTVHQPQKALLRVYYQGAKLLRCIKLADDQIVNHPIFATAFKSEDSAVTLTVERFDDDICDLVKNLVSRTTLKKT